MPTRKAGFISAYSLSHADSGAVGWLLFFSDWLRASVAGGWVAGNNSMTYDDCPMAAYVLGHHLKGEGKRLALMSKLLDPMHQRYLRALDLLKRTAWRFGRFSQA